MKLPAQLREHRYAVAMVAILAVMLLAVGLLTQQAWRTARTHQRVVNTALQGYATLAAALYRERIEVRVFQGLTPVRAFASGRMGESASQFPSVTALGDSVRALIACRCRTVLAPQFLFRADVRTGAIESIGASASRGDMERWITAALPAALKDYERAQTYSRLIGSVNGKERLVYFSARRNVKGEPVAVYGIEPATASLDSVVFKEGLAEAMLQGVVLGDSIPNDSLVSVRAYFPSGAVLYRSVAAYASPYIGREVLSPQVGSLKIETTLNPALAERLVIGGVPSSQLPLLVGILLLTGMLVVAAVVLTWRTWTLARMRADFTSGVSHDLRTPVTQIMLFAETIALGRLRTVAECRREARVIAEEGRRLLDLIENVLHFARSERYELPISRRLTNVSQLVRDVVEGYRPMAGNVGINLRASIEEDVGARVDPPALQRSLRNVLDNAIKYAHTGREAHVGLVLIGTRANIWVDDRGPGVPARDRQRVWQAFVRLERDMNQATGGSGIGLAVVRDVIVRHGGVVRVEDAPGGGARFVMELPDACRLGPRAVAESEEDHFRVGEL